MAKGMGMISVIIPHYNDPDSLAKVIAAVRAQESVSEVEIIIADDGSAVAPDVPGATVVTQEDLGFRAAAARNLGASTATGDVLAFLDADTVPEPGYLAAACRHVEEDWRAVVVGKRLTGAAREEPAWLRDAWRDTDNLSRADDTSWRFIISSVVTCSRRFFEAIGGFDASFVGYGGEDWEFGFRAWNAGATFVHEPDAVAVHDEEDFGARYSDPVEEAHVKNIESVALAHRITHPLTRPDGVHFELADIGVRVGSMPEHSPHAAAWHSPGVLEQVITSWLRADSVVYCDPALGIPELFRDDPRVRSDSEHPGYAAPNRLTFRLNVELGGPWALTDSTAFLHGMREGYYGPDGISISDDPEAMAPSFAAFTARSLARGADCEGHPVDPVDAGLTWVSGPIRLERLFAGW
nr:Glycosyl transferase, family 2 [Streptococcus thermophilus]